MIYKTEKTGVSRVEVIEATENKHCLCVCETVADAELVASALNARQSSFRRLAAGFIDSVDAGEGKLGDWWRGLVRINGLNESEAAEVWRLIYEIMRNEQTATK